MQTLQNTKQIQYIMDINPGVWVNSARFQT